MKKSEFEGVQGTGVQTTTTSKTSFGIKILCLKNIMRIYKFIKLIINILSEFEGGHPSSPSPPLTASHCMKKCEFEGVYSP